MNHFYRKFEDRHRGSRELIKQRLEVYLPFIRPLKAYYPFAEGLDIGCGRGEWLEVANAADFKVKGIDINEDMLGACHALQLNVETAEALDYMKRLPSTSLAVVSGFHIAEHLPFKRLRKILSQVLRVLLPGGLLILETPNPENLKVASANFYLDPTHKRPIPPLLLQFMAEYAGFERVKVIRLQEEPELMAATQIGLLNVLIGVSPDYAIVAQKGGTPELDQALDDEFHKSFGISLEFLAEKYDRHIRQVVDEVREEVNDMKLTGLEQAMDKVSQAEHRAALHEAQALAAEQRASELEVRVVAAEDGLAQMERRAALAEATADAQRCRAEAAEGRAAEHETQALAAQQRAVEQEARAVAAEDRSAKLERQSFQAEATADAQRCRAEAAEECAILTQSELDALSKSHEELKTRLVGLDSELGDLQSRCDAAEQCANEQRRRAEHAEVQFRMMTAQAYDWHDQILRINRSISWRITAPLRVFRRLVLAIGRGILRGVRWLGMLVMLILSLPFMPIFILFLPYVLNRPQLRDRIGKRIKEYPRLRRALRLLAYKTGFIPYDPRLERPGSTPVSRWPVQTTDAARPTLSQGSPPVIVPSGQVAGLANGHACTATDLGVGEKRDEALPDIWFGSLKPESLPAAMEVGRTYVVRVKLSNHSAHDWRWTAQQPLRAAFHWWRAQGGPVLFDGERSELPFESIPSNSTRWADIKVTAPPQVTGTVELELTLVQDGVCWLEERGFNTWRHIVKIQPAQVDLMQLTPHARAIFHDLQQALLSSQQRH